jgi:hypothetical protein
MNNPEKNASVLDGGDAAGREEKDGRHWHHVNPSGGAEAEELRFNEEIPPPGPVESTGPSGFVDRDCRTDSHAGVPRCPGHAGSDDDLLALLRERLLENDYIDAEQVRVSVRHGAVNIQGRVKDALSKRAIDDLVSGCVGIRSYVNALEVGPDPSALPGA